MTDRTTRNSDLRPELTVSRQRGYRGYPPECLTPAGKVIPVGVRQCLLSYRKMYSIGFSLSVTQLTRAVLARRISPVFRTIISKSGVLLFGMSCSNRGFDFVF